MSGLTQKDYANAMYSQSACNLNGVVIALAEVLPRIREEAKQTIDVNTHPIVRLYVEQIAFLASGRNYARAFDACERGAGWIGQEVES